MPSKTLLVGNTHITVVGSKKAGKSNFVHHVCDNVSGHLVYDFAAEYDPDRFNRYVPEYRRGKEAKAELDGVVERLVMDAPHGKRPRLLVIEEANRLVPSSGKAPESVAELIDMNRHYGVSIMFVTRRPAKLDTDAVELADYIAAFRLGGPNNVKKLNREADGLGDAVKDLTDFEWCLFERGRGYERMAPLPEYETTGSL